MEKHTRGKWDFCSQGGKISKQYANYIFSGETFIASVERLENGMDNDTKWDEHVANGSLIASAPDLYFACRAALLTLEDDEHYYKCKEIVQTLKQAIRKATGE